MAVKTILPTTNLTFDDIRDTLNNFGGSVTNVVATAFTSTAKINRWSRNKPESYKADFIAGGGSPKASNNFGLTVPSFDSITSLFGSSSVWSYTLPSGGVNSPYRLGDFCGYFVYAGAPISGVLPSALKDTDSYTSGSNYMFGFVFKFNKAASMYHTNADTYIGIQELYSYPNKIYTQNCYPGVAIRWKQTGNTSWNYCYLTSTKKMSEITALSEPTAAVVLDVAKAPWSSIDLNSKTIDVEVAYALFALSSVTDNGNSNQTSIIYSGSSVNGISLETTTNANRKSYTVSKSYLMDEATYTITASYYISGTTLRIDSFKVKMVPNANYKEVNPSIYVRPYVVVVHNNGSTTTQKYISSNVQSMLHADWINASSKEFTWTRTSESDQTTWYFYNVSSLKNISFIVYAGTTLASVSGTTIGRQVKSLATQNFTTGSVQTVTG